MKTKIILLIVLLLQSSCGTRKTDLQKTISEKSVKISQYEKQISEQNNELSILQNSVKSKIEKIDFLNKEVSYLRKTVENLNKKLSEENSQEAKTKISEEYFESGKLKSKISETESKTLAKKNQEIDYWKSSATTIKEELNLVKKDLSTSYKSNEIYSQKNKSQAETITKLNSKIKNLETEKNKKTEKKGLQWYWIVIITLLSWELVKFVFKKYKII